MTLKTHRYKKSPIGLGGNHSLSGHGTNTQTKKKCSAPFVIQVWYFYSIGLYIFESEERVFSIILFGKSSKKEGDNLQ